MLERITEDAELIKALRICAEDEPCIGCAYHDTARCIRHMKRDAADAIEYLILQNEMAQRAIRGLDATCNWLTKENERLKDGYEARKRDEEYKEWLHDDRPCPDFAREE